MTADDLLAADDLITRARKEGATLAVTSAGSIRLSGPESLVEELRPEVARLKPEILARLSPRASRLSRSVPPVRDRKTRSKSKPVPAVPAVPALSGTAYPVPDGPEERTELRINNLWIITDGKGQTTSHSFTPPASREEVERWYPGCVCSPEISEREPVE